jgi:4-methylaminobutanoate oxidase (formaldehyde-forming)
MAHFPSQAQVVIIGGGVGGCSIAYHLTKMGWTDVVVLERFELTSGSTWHSAGLVGQLRSDVNLTKMMKYSPSTGSSGRPARTRLARGGRLELACRPNDWSSRQVASSSFGLPSSCSAQPKHCSSLRTQGVLRGYTPTDGSIDPTGLTKDRRRSKSRAARFFEHTVVTGITVYDGTE